MKYLKIGIVVLVLFIAGSCDCQYHISGVVMNKITMQPIANVSIGKTDTTDLDNPFNRKTYTHENGEFDIYGIAGECSEVTVYFTNQNFHTKKITLQNNCSDTIFLEPKSEIEVGPFK